MGREVSSLDWQPCSAGSQKSEQNAQDEAGGSPSRSCSCRRRLWGEVSPCVPLAFLRCCCCPKRSLLARRSETGWVHSSRKAPVLSVPSHSGTTYRPSSVTPISLSCASASLRGKGSSRIESAGVDWCSLWSLTVSHPALTLLRDAGEGGRLLS